MADDAEEPMMDQLGLDHNHHHHDVEELPTTDDIDFLDRLPSRDEKISMRKANKRPSEWLRLLCKEWAAENAVLVEAADQKFIEYKPYLKGYLTSQLLVRLSLAVIKEDASSYPDLWGILGVQDDFDKAYIVAQVERFCSLYNIRGPVEELETTATTMMAPAAVAPPPPPPTAVQWDALNDPTAMAAAAAAANGIPGGYDYATAAAVAAATAATTDPKALAKKQQQIAQASEVSKAHRMVKDAEKALEHERRQNLKREQRRLSQEKREQKNREREQVAIRKVAEKIARESSREERRKKKLELRQQREKFAQEQKDAALKRAAELVSSNRVPIEITRGAAAAKAAATAVLQQSGVAEIPFNNNQGQKKARSAIVVSTATDLHQIVTHSKNLWAKYNAIAKEHNQKVNWITVAKELGIHVKVREKYARMHSRAEQRGFDWVRHGYYKIKDHPEIFLEPTQAEQKAKMPPPPPDATTTVLISKDTNKEVDLEDPSKGEMEDQVMVKVEDPVTVHHEHSVNDEAIASAAAIVDASGVGVGTGAGLIGEPDPTQSPTVDVGLGTDVAETEIV